MAKPKPESIGLRIIYDGTEPLRWSSNLRTSASAQRF